MKTGNAAGGNAGTTATTTTPDSISQQGNCGPGGHIFHGNDCASDNFPYDDGTCPPGRIHLPGPDQYYCSIPPVLPGSTTGNGGGFIQMIPMKTGIVPAIPICPAGDAPDANGNCIPNEGHMLNGKCPSGSHSIGTEGNDGVIPICQLDNPSTPTPGTGGTTSSTTGGATTTTSTDNKAQQTCGEGNYNKATAHYDPNIGACVDKHNVLVTGECPSGFTTKF